ncbi:polysaccharide biosynthesis protein [Massilia sp. B-10]|nr:polysaccharide biosynthesis protein [Massilia sp. B-10]
MVRSEAQPNGTIEIRYVGLRPGEKLYEELLIGNNVTGTEHPLIQRAKEAEFEWPVLQQMLAQLDDACARFDHGAVRLLMQKLVREYAPSSDIVDHVWSQRVQTDQTAPEACELPPGAVLPVIHDSRASMSA